MTYYKREQAEKDAAKIAAALMAASARTAPKGRGVDAMESLIIDGDDMEKLAAAMERKAGEKPPYLSSALKRNAESVRNSSCVLLIGVLGDPKKIEQPLDCGACGYDSCKRMSAARGSKQAKDFGGPTCIFEALDLGIALGSAVKVAAELGIDTRIMFTIGATARELGLLDSDVIMGIPLSVTAKSPYFDRQ